MGAWLVLCVGYVVRMYAAPYLVMNSFYMLAILIQYFAFQNPDIFLDRKTGALSHLTATPYLQEINERGPFSAFAIGINDYMESRSLYSERQMTKGLRAITRYLKSVFPDCQVIYAAMGRFVLLSTKETPFTKVHEEVNARMQAPWVDKHAHLYLTASYAMFQGQLKRRKDIELFFDYTATALHRAEEQHDVIVMEQSLFDQARLSTTVWRAVGRASTVAASVRLLGTICVYTESNCSHTSVGTVGAVRRLAPWNMPLSLYTVSRSTVLPAARAK